MTARDVKRSLPPEQWILNTIEDYQTLQRSRAFEEKIIELIPSKNLTEIVNITDLYTTFKWNQIKVLVDKYRNAEQKKKENNDKPSKTKKYRSAAPKDGTAAQQEDEEKDR